MNGYQATIHWVLQHTEIIVIVVVAALAALRFRRRQEIRVVATKKQGLKLFNMLWNNYPRESVQLLRHWVTGGNKQILSLIVEESNEEDLARYLRLLGIQERREWMQFLQNSNQEQLSKRKLEDADASLSHDVLAVFGLKDSTIEIEIYKRLTALPLNKLAHRIASYPGPCALLLHHFRPSMVQALAEKMTAGEYTRWIEQSVKSSTMAAQKQEEELLEVLKSSTMSGGQQFEEKLMKLYLESTLEQESIILEQLVKSCQRDTAILAINARMPFELILQTPREILLEALYPMNIHERARLVIGLGINRGIRFMKACYPIQETGYQQFLAQEISRIRSTEGEERLCMQDLHQTWLRFIEYYQRALSKIRGHEKELASLKSQVFKCSTDRQSQHP